MVDCITNNSQEIRKFLLNQGYEQWSITKSAYTYVLVAPKKEGRDIPFFYEITARYAHRKKLFDILPYIPNVKLIKSK